MVRAAKFITCFLVKAIFIKFYFNDLGENTCSLQAALKSNALGLKIKFNKNCLN